MKYLEYTSLLSNARMSKYIKACNGNKAHTGKMLGERAKDIQAKAAELKKSGTYSPDRIVSTMSM